ncbi:TPA: segregation/condensation protein A [bacterium]|nr:segregation/condensation protein A [bacterium]
MHQVKLEVFEGPLDLLLHLVRKNEVDIFDIPIHQITSQYLDYLALMRDYDLNTTSEFLVMAAILIQIKSKMLLPRIEPTVEEIEEDPRSELTRMLLEYKEYKEAAHFLNERRESQDKVYSRTPNKDTEGFVEANLFELLDAFAKLIQKREERVGEIIADEINIAQRMEELMSFFERTERKSFSLLLSKYRTKRELIATLLALLELVRLRKLRVLQSEPFSEIWIYRDAA